MRKIQSERRVAKYRETASNSKVSTTIKHTLKRKLDGGGQRCFISERCAEEHEPLSSDNLTRWNSMYNALDEEEKNEYKKERCAG